MTLDEHPMTAHRALRGDAWDDLDQFLIGDEDELPEVLADLEQVERTLRAIGWRRRKIAQAEELARSVKDRADLHVENERHRFDPSFLEDRLRGYHQARLADDPKAKSISFPSGALKARKSPDRVEVDPVPFLAVQPEGSSLVRVKREPDKSAIAAHVKATGEVLAGVELVPGEVRFSIETDT